MADRSKPSDFVPPYPASHLDLEKTSAFAMSLFGVQYPCGGNASDMIYEVIGLFAKADVGKPNQVEHAQYTDPAGFKNYVMMPYWSDGAVMEAFFRRGDVEAWMGIARTGEIGWWRESLHGNTSAADIAFAGRTKYGVARDREIKTMQFHGYMGSMRDRVPIIFRAMPMASGVGFPPSQTRKPEGAGCVSWACQASCASYGRHSAANMRRWISSGHSMKSSYPCSTTVCGTSWIMR